MLWAVAWASVASAAQQPDAVTLHGNVLTRYCVPCHNMRAKTGGLVLDPADLAHVAQTAAVWERVIRKLRAGTMPPAGQPRPEERQREQLAGWLEGELDRAAAAQPDPGHTEALHRLNRAEYQNAVRDILGVDVDVTSLLPPDDASFGFDNIAGVLKVSPSQMERYLATARKISRLAVGSPLPAAVAETFKVSQYERQYERAEQLPFGTRGGALIHYNFPQSGEYGFRVWFSCNQTSASCDPVGGFADRHQLELTIDGERVHIYDMPPEPWAGANGIWAGDPARWEVRVPVKAGVREVGVAFLKLPSYEPSDGPRVRFQRPSYEGNMVTNGLGVYQPHLASVTISGPFSPQSEAGTRSHRVFVCMPTTRVQEDPCATQILATIARRAYRRPGAKDEVQALVALYDQTRRTGGSFESGLEMALRGVLVSPHFLFRMESEPKRDHSVYRVADRDLASRLSFFLWSSVPDDELLDVAEQGRLKDPSVLDAQVRRMLADPRSEALTKNFVAQWLQLRKLEAVTPSEVVFPDFDERLRQAMRRETELFFDSIVREDRNVVDLLAANYTFVNERLALHYGIPNIKGPHFRRVMLPDDSPRRGLLGQASILTVTSHAIRTSPVIRGKWILENILGSPPPPPPANVPPLPERISGAKPASMRDRMAAHRSNPVCAGCHSTIDPAGFALENFDAVGRWRTRDESFAPIDASGALPDGSKFDGLIQFRARLMAKPERFVNTLTEKLLIYALGRGLEYYDMPAVRAIVRDAARMHYRLSAIVTGIVQSPPFQMRRASVTVASSSRSSQ
jgi:hypothetical protein